VCFGLRSPYHTHPLVFSIDPWIKYPDTGRIIVVGNSEKHIGEVMWEMHMPKGFGRKLLESTACIQPCGNDASYDREVRDRWIEQFRTKVARVEPDDLMFPLMETQWAGYNEMRFVPREIAGNPTYGMYYRNMDQYMASVGMLAESPFVHFGLMDDEEMIADTHQYIRDNFESLAYYWHINRNGPKCVDVQLMSEIGALVTYRHLWLKITHVSAESLINQTRTSEISIDGTAI